MGKKILLADDSITIQKVVELTFSDGDFDVLSVGSGDQAIHKAREFKPDIALLDVIMPEKNGYEVCQVLKQDSELSHIPVLLLTGTFESFDRARAEEVGADGYLTKPFESQMLISKVEELLSSTPRQVSASAQAGPMEVVTSGTILNVENPAAGEPTASPAAPEPPPQEAALPPEPAPQEAPPPPEPTPQEATPPPQPATEPAPPAPPAGSVSEPQQSAAPETAAEVKASSAESFSPFEPLPPPVGADAPPPDLPAAGEPAPAPPQAKDSDEIMMANEGPPAPPVETTPPVAEPVSADTPPPVKTTPGEADSYETTFEMPGRPETIALSGPRPAEEQGHGTLYPGPDSQPAPAAAPSHTLTPEQLDEIVRRVVEQLSDQVIREVAWEVIPDLAEILIRKRISELERDGERRG